MLAFKLIALLICLIVFVQMYNFAVRKKGEEKQRACRIFGIICTTAGIACLIYRTVFCTFSGLILIMMGLRLIAHGLDRLNKTVFIDRYEEDSMPAAERPLEPTAAEASPRVDAAACRMEPAESSGSVALGPVAESSAS
jgi:hypothetical protein